MSEKERPRADNGRGGREGSGGVEDEIGEGPKEEGDPKEKKRKARGEFRLRKGKKTLDRTRKQERVGVKSGCCWRRVGGGGRCWLCWKEPRTLDSSGESPTRDPNSSEFTFDMLRELIEKNDFYSKECNPHLDADDG